MLMKSLVAAGALLVATSAYAETTVVARTPGHRMHSAMIVTHGASAYAPGHIMHHTGVKVRGASVYTPSHTARITTRSHTTVGSAPMTEERSSTRISKSRSSTSAGVSVGGASVGAGVTR